MAAAGPISFMMANTAAPIADDRFSTRPAGFPIRPIGGGRRLARRPAFRSCPARVMLRAGRETTSPQGMDPIRRSPFLWTDFIRKVLWRARSIVVTSVDGMRFALPRGDLLRARAAAARFDPHLHATYSVVALKTGSAKIWSRRSSRIVQAGDVFFVNPFEVHASVSMQEPTEYEVLYPSRAFVGACASIDTCEERLTIITDVSPPTPRTRALIETLSAAKIDEAATEAALRQVLAACTFSVERSTASLRAVAHTACAIIGENCTHPIRTEDLADRIGVHKSHLVRAFSASIGLAPQTYIRQVRVAKARDLICAGMALSEAAQALGFCDQAHLAREFKKVFGVPPGALSRDIGLERTSKR